MKSMFLATNTIVVVQGNITVDNLYHDRCQGTLDWSCPIAHMETVIISMHLYHSKEDGIYMMVSESTIHQELV